MTLPTDMQCTLIQFVSHGFLCLLLTYFTLQFQAHLSTVCMWRSEPSFWESTLFFHNVGMRGWNQVVRLGGCRHWAMSVAPSLQYFLTIPMPFTLHILLFSCPTPKLPHWRQNMWCLSLGSGFCHLTCSPTPMSCKCLISLFMAE